MEEDVHRPNAHTELAMQAMETGIVIHPSQLDNAETFDDVSIIITNHTLETEDALLHKPAHKEIKLKLDVSVCSFKPL